MEIRLAAASELHDIQKYDSHIPARRLAACIENGLVRVLRDGEQIVGVLRYSLFWQSIPFLDLIFIDEACRGQGLGRQMMASWENAMAEQGYSHVMLSTQADEDARYFYGHLGYRRCGGFFPPDQDAEELMFLKPLDT